MSQPVINLPFYYVNNLQQSWVSTTSIQVAAGQCRDSTNTYDIVIPSAITLNAAVNGINGLDTGSLASLTWYAVYAVADSSGFKTPGVMLSTSSSKPTLPFGYSIFRRIGWVLTDSSSHILLMYEVGNGEIRKVFFDAIINIGSISSASWTVLSCATAIPPTSNIGFFEYKYTPASAGNALQIRLAGSSSTATQSYVGTVASQAQTGFNEIYVGTSQSIAVQSTSGSDTAVFYGIGYEDHL